MSKSYFQFKQFGIQQDRCAMKVGTDGVLLGAIAGGLNSKKMLEIGVGTGVVSIMLAQRFPELLIEGVEIDQDAYEQAKENAAISPWHDRIGFYHCSFQEFVKLPNKKFDLIVSNPPYFPNHLKSPDSKRNLALHQDALGFSELIEGVKKVIAPEGEFWLILPPEEMKKITWIASQHGFYSNQKIIIRDRISKPVLRQVTKFSLSGYSEPEKELVLKNEEGDYTSIYAGLLKDFLIIF